MVPWLLLHILCHSRPQGRLRDRLWRGAFFLHGGEAWKICLRAATPQRPLGRRSTSTTRSNHFGMCWSTRSTKCQGSTTSQVRSVSSAGATSFERHYLDESSFIDDWLSEPFQLKLFDPQRAACSHVEQSPSFSL